MNIYKQKDGRKFIVYKDEDNKYHSKAYARYLMEQHLGRKLTNEEEVYHKDGFAQNIVLEYLDKKSNRTGNFLIECHQIRGKSQ